MTNGNEWFLTYLTYLGNRGHGDIMQKRDVFNYSYINKYIFEIFSY